MARACVIVLYYILASTSVVCAERTVSSAILATATVVPAIGFVDQTDAQVIEGNRIRKFPLTAEAFRVHRRQADGTAVLLFPTVCITVERRDEAPTVTLISTAN